MKFRYYITDTFGGAIKGTDSDEVAKSYAMSSDFFVLDSEIGKWISEDGHEIDVENASE